MINDIRRVIENDRIILHKPNAQELKYRKKLNQSCYGVTKTPQQLEAWYKRFNNNLRNYYAYIVSKEDKRFVGEVSIHYSFECEKYLVNILVENQYRNRGFGYEALKLMVDYVFTVMNLDAIYEKVSIDQEYPKDIYKRVGFQRLDDDYIMMTKKQYNAILKESRLKKDTV